jgi:asparagine synthase (glutamine-hydrolysing)
MCGIIGFINLSASQKREELSAACKEMCDTLRHRGPDSSGIWVDESSGIALGHRRLSILDLSESGHQPMVSHSGRYIIVLNGEIYNFKSIRREIEGSGYIFKSNSDTEVALSAIERWGFADALSRFNGMFAFALWDRKERVLRLVRDRLGEKPLYYGWSGKSFIFASELKALRKHPDFEVEVNREALALYLKYAYIPAPYSIYMGIYKLLPGMVLTLSNFTAGFLPAPEPYWSAKASLEDGIRNRFKGSKTDALKELDSLLKDAINMRLNSDVPLGVFLSGGIDSSLVTALMQAQSSRPVKTFTIGFCEKTYNEAQKSARIAEYLGTEHTELFVRPQDSLEVIPQLADIYDEPFADSSAIPTFLISKLTRSYVTVALSGDGGDEVFGGYNRYFWAPGIWNKIKSLPYPLRDAGGRFLHVLPVRAWDYLGKAVSCFFPENMKQQNCGYKIHKLASLLDAINQQELYGKLVSFWPNSFSLVKNTSGASLSGVNNKNDLKPLSFSEWMMYNDLITYLPDDILVKVDRASMAVSLETRAVFLDHRVVEFAFSLPAEMKVYGNTGKLLLRDLLTQYLPNRLFDFQKMGFALPLDSWLRGPLRPWAESLLDEKKIRSEGFFNPEPIRKKWQEYLSGKRNWQYHIWIILMFQAWKDKWL